MGVGYFLLDKSYGIFDWIVALAITGGVSIFAFGQKADRMTGGIASGLFSTDKFFILGAFLIFGYVATDAFTSNYQKAIFNEHQISPVQMSFGINLCSLGISFASISTDLPMLWEFVQYHPEFKYDILMMATCSACGGLLIFYTIRRFGPVIFATAMTLRQMLNFLVSVLWYGHEIKDTAWIGSGIVFAALLSRVLAKWLKKC